MTLVIFASLKGVSAVKHMNNSIVDDLKWQFRYGNVVNRLVLVNITVFLFFCVVQLFFFFAQQEGLYEVFMEWLYLPTATLKIIKQPWSFITYQFLHADFLHILFNMLWLWWMGRILVQYMNQKRILALYFLGGFAGALLCILAYNIFPVFNEAVNKAHLVGASASVMAIILATATLLPNYEIRLIFIGFVKLKYIALVAVLLDVITINGSNPGGHIAHLGGAFFGWLFVYQLQRGTDLSKGLVNSTEWLKQKLAKNPKPKIVYKNEERLSKEYPKTKKSLRKDKQEQVDAILDKISETGYDNLTKEEKQILFKFSEED